MTVAFIPHQERVRQQQTSTLHTHLSLIIISTTTLYFLVPTQRDKFPSNRTFPFFLSSIYFFNTQFINLYKFVLSSL